MGAAEKIEAIDLSEAARFLRLLDAEAEAFHFRTFDDSPAKRRGLARTLSGTLDDVGNELAAMNARGAGVFVVVNHGGQRANEIDRARAVFADTDGAALEPIMRCGLEPHIVVESSPGKWHAYWLTDGLALPEFGAIQKTIAAMFGTDPSIHDLPRVMRLPGFLHQKGKPHRVRIIHESGGLPYSAPRVREAFSAPASHEPIPSAAAAPVAALQAVPAGSSNAELFRRILAGDNLHDSTRDVAFRLIDDGIPPAKVVAMIRGTMEAMPSRGDPVRWQARYAEIPRLVAGAIEKKAPKAMPQQWRLDRIGDLLTQPSPTRWLVRGFLDLPSLACVFGAPGSGKTFLTLDIACHVATGALWCGHRVEQGAVVYLAGEGHIGIRRRFLAWQEHHKRPLRDAPLFLSSAAIELAGNAQSIVEAIRGTVNGAHPSLVIIDTLHRHMASGADENSATDMGAMIAAADAVKESFSCCVVFVHHTPHTANRERGSSALRGAWDWSYSVQRGDQGPMIVQCRKAKDHEPPEQVQFNLTPVTLPWLDEEGEHESSAALEPTGSTENALGANQLLAMTSLRKLSYSAKGELVTITDWRKESGVARNRWREILDSLTERGLVIIEGEDVRLP